MGSCWTTSRTCLVMSANSLFSSVLTTKDSVRAFMSHISAAPNGPISRGQTSAQAAPRPTGTIATTFGQSQPIAGTLSNTDRRLASVFSEIVQSLAQALPELHQWHVAQESFGAINVGQSVGHVAGSRRRVPAL